MGIKLFKHNAPSKEGSTLVVKVVVMGVLLVISACSVYTVGVQVGMETKAAVKTVEKTQQAQGTQAIAQTTDNLIQPSTNSYPLAIPEGQAQALPSIRLSKEEDATINRKKIYGGQGDKEHLGGFTAYDGQGVSPAVWKHMINSIGVKSLIDVGCGKGVSTLYFESNGVDVLCLEGSHDAVEHSLLPDPANQVVEHDFSRGPYWPGKTYDAVWSVEFLEHVGRNYQHNYIQAMRKAAYLFVSHSRWGGWHHVEVHSPEWWITRMTSFGFVYSKELTEEIRHVASIENREGAANKNNPDKALEALGPDGEHYNAQHVWLNMLVFINPAVAALPEHAHLLAEQGCYKGREGGVHIHRECDPSKGESVLPESFRPLQWSVEAHKAWLEKVKSSIKA
ncbi:expressed unknown protein [Seminavis robusta]|uniref:Methyltransferase type 11 domain-containing protein n=1 Tax=Seminavis robusta TaxID=568900 RepID=A0A9N8ELZ9_9STRA|nr:expressed unknown protein [Seminavis robusta]|eukprot:Sro1380_g267790.1 n/a (393) ;mRNA; r:14654-16472